MKKFILMAGILACSIAQAQISVTGKNGQVITNGYVYTTTALTPQNVAELPLHVTNVSNDPINLKLRVDSIENTDGQNVQFCFGGQCFFNITVGKVVPTNQGVDGMTLAPGASNGNDDHFWNFNPGTGGDVVVGLSFIQLDSAGNIIGDPLVSFTYKYSPTAATTDFSALQQMGISLKSTVVNSALEMDSTQKATLEIFGTTGQTVKTAHVTSGGSQSVDLSGMAAGIYIARFTNEENKSSQIRIVKK